jgi:hypothetical protein
MGRQELLTQITDDLFFLTDCNKELGICFIDSDVSAVAKPQPSVTAALFPFLEATGKEDSSFLSFLLVVGSETDSCTYGTLGRSAAEIFSISIFKTSLS